MCRAPISCPSITGACRSWPKTISCGPAESRRFIGMCSLCAALGGSRYWADAAGHEAFSRDGGKLSTRAERQERVRLLGRIAAFYGVSIRDWGGSSYMLETQ